RSFQGPDELPEQHLTPAAKPDASDWLSMQQAACELGVSITTVRRMIRKGRLRNRIVPRHGGFAYLIYLPGSKHAQLARQDGTRTRLKMVDRDDSTVDAPRLATGTPATD